jgi:hypothetical protein
MEAIYSVEMSVDCYIPKVITTITAAVRTYNLNNVINRFYFNGYMCQVVLRILAGVYEHDNESY